MQRKPRRWPESRLRAYLQRIMISGGWRYCDACDVRIFDRESYYSGIGAPETAGQLAIDPKRSPSFTPLPDGRVRFELCSRCVAAMPELAEKLKLELAGARR